jgi:hypothetical protein
LAGGEWTIVFDQKAANTAGVMNIDSIHDPSPVWPPTSTSLCKLGSGDGSRGTYGPATIWRRQLLSSVGFPLYGPNGEPIESIGDAIFWEHLTRKNIACIRAPHVVGRYHSHPSDQAEFRAHNDNEMVKRGIRVCKELWF